MNLSSPPDDRNAKECTANPRTCRFHPDNRLADELRNPILRWAGPVGIRSRTNAAVAFLTASIKQYPKGHPVRSKAVSEYNSCISEIDLLFRSLETALKTYAERTCD